MNAAHPEGAAVDAPFNPLVVHPARVYSVWTGGKDHYPADRKAAHEAAACRPEVVGQFLDMAADMYAGLVMTGRQGHRR